MWKKLLKKVWLHQCSFYMASSITQKNIKLTSSWIFLIWCYLISYWIKIINSPKFHKNFDISAAKEDSDHFFLIFRTWQYVFNLLNKYLHIFTPFLLKNWIMLKKIILKKEIFVASEASELIFKIVIFHDVPPRSST